MITLEQSSQIIKIFRKYFLNAYKIIFIIDQKQADSFKERNLYYYEQFHQDHHQHDHKDQATSSCCGSFFSKVYIPEKEQTGLEQIVYKMFRPFSLKEQLPKVLDYCAQRFKNIKSSGKDLGWDQQTEVYILNEVLREGLQLYFIKLIRAEMQKEQYIDSKQQLLLATPQTWTSKYPKQELDYLKPQFIADLMKTGAGKIHQFTNLDFSRSLFKELDFLERDGRFEEQLQESSIREDKTFWINLSQIDKASFKMIYSIAFLLSSLPYEFNAKTQILAQISETFQFSYFNQNRKIHKKHFDSSTDKSLDTGKKISIMYFCLEDESSQNQVIIDDKIITVKQGTLIGLMSRVVPYEIKCDGSKVFCIRYWIDGPKDGQY